MPITPEAGLRRQRVEFVREGVDSEGNAVTPTNPEFQAYSDTVRAFEWSPDPGAEEQRGLSDYDPNNIFRGPESHSITVSYDLQRWLIDAVGDPLDAAYDGMARNADGLLPNTHTVVQREEKDRVAASNTYEGDVARATRLYTVGTGGYIDEAVLTGDPGDQQPVAVELTYEFEAVRSYKIDQPEAATTLIVKSSDATDTTQTVTIESENAAAKETLTLNGTTNVLGATSFGDIDAVYLSDETAGDVQVFANDGDATTPVVGAQFTVIRGENSYDGVQGDRGVPALGTGSRAGAVGTNYEIFLGDTITRGGSRLAMDINSFSLTVSNNTDRTIRQNQFSQRVHAGERNLSVEATVIGETESHDRVMDSLTNNASDIVWMLSGGNVTVQNAHLTEPSGRPLESGEAFVELDNTFTGKGLAVTSV